jgi:hypothetical protein
MAVVPMVRFATTEALFRPWAAYKFKSLLLLVLESSAVTQGSVTVQFIYCHLQTYVVKQFQVVLKKH